MDKKLKKKICALYELYKFYRQLVHEERPDEERSEYVHRINIALRMIRSQPVFGPQSAYIAMKINVLN